MERKSRKKARNIEEDPLKKYQDDYDKMIKKIKEEKERGKK